MQRRVYSMPKNIVRKISSDDIHCSFVVGAQHTSLANVLRRALMNNVSNIAPSRVHFRKNTSCQTDEYIAHRIGLIPFKQLTNEIPENYKMSLQVDDRTAFSSDFTQSGVIEPCQKIPIMKMRGGQSLDIDVFFERGSGNDHSRFSHIGPVSFCQEETGAIHMSYETFGGKSADEYMLHALASILKMIDDTIYFIDVSYDTMRVRHGEIENMHLI